MKEEAKKLAEMLRKKGLAQIIIELGPHSNDEDFGKVACKVTISVKDTQDRSKTYPDQIKEFRPNSDPEHRTFQVRAETVVGTLRSISKRLLPPFEGEKPRSLEITVKVEPIDDWITYYESSTKTVDVKAGETKLVPVSMKPKTKRLDKPLPPRL